MDLLSLAAILISMSILISILILSRPPRKTIPTITYFIPRKESRGLQGMRQLPLTILTLTTLLITILLFISLLNPTLHISPFRTLIIEDTTPSMQTALRPPSYVTLPLFTTYIRTSKPNEALITILPHAKGSRVILITDGYTRINPLTWNLIRSQAAEARILTAQNRVQENIGIINASLTPTSFQLTLLNTYPDEKILPLTIQNHTGRVIKKIRLPSKSLTTITLPRPTKETSYTLPKNGFPFDDTLTIIPPAEEAAIIGKPSKPIIAALDALGITTISEGTISLQKTLPRIIILANATPTAFLPSLTERILTRLRQGGRLISICTPPMDLPPALNPYVQLTQKASEELVSPESSLPLPRLPVEWEGRVKTNTTIIARLNGTPIITRHAYGNGSITTILPCAEDLAYTPTLPLLLKTSLANILQPSFKNNPLSLDESLPTHKLPPLKEKKAYTPLRQLTPLLLILLIIIHLTSIILRRPPAYILLLLTILLLSIIFLSLHTIPQQVSLPRDTITLLDTSIRMLLTQPPSLPDDAIHIPLTHYENLTPYLTPNGNLTIISSGHLDGSMQAVKRTAERLGMTITPIIPPVLIPDYAVILTAPRISLTNTTSIHIRVTSNQENDTMNHTLIIKTPLASYTRTIRTWEERTIPIPLNQTYTPISVDLLTEDGIRENNHARIVITRQSPPRIRIFGDPQSQLAHLAKRIGMIVTHNATAYIITKPVPPDEQTRLLQEAVRGASILLTPEALQTWQLPLAEPAKRTPGEGNTPAVILLIDISGSSLQPTNMSSNLTRLVQAKSIAGSIASQLPPDSLVSLITFNTRATTILPLREVRRTPLLIGAIYTLPAYGGTSIAVGLRAAREQAVRIRQSRIILLTDGYSSTPSEDIAEARMLAGKAQLIIIPLTSTPNLQHLTRIARAAHGILTDYTPGTPILTFTKDTLNTTSKRLIRPYPSSLIPRDPTGRVERLISLLPASWATVPLTTSTGEPVLITSRLGSGRISLLATPANTLGSLATEDSWIIANILTSGTRNTPCILASDEGILDCPRSIPPPENITRLIITPTRWQAVLPEHINTSLTTPQGDIPLSRNYPPSLQYTQNTRIFRQLNLTAPPQTVTIPTHPSWPYVIALILLLIEVIIRRKYHLHP